ncbi:MAG TPA: phage tail protein, partial [Kofleriaceae bacterium]|nr:phage tail protein [Kofleriaceae bacterium]
MSAPTIRPAAELRPSVRLRELLPGVYRQRDAAIAAPPIQLAERPPLTDLVGVLGGGLDALYDAVGALWDDHFVERCDPAALPLLAELFGVQLLSTDRSAQRALVARIVGWRRRKGTLITLEEILTETSTWDTEVDEGMRSVLASLELAHVAPWRGRTALVWDPIGLADPLTRRSPGDARPRGDERRVRSQVLGQLPGEEIDDTLRRLGRVDAGKHAASPRTLDLRGWVRPDAVLIRTARLVPVELEELAATMIAPTASGQQRGRIDPLGRDAPLVWLHPVTRPDLAAGVTARHEPVADEPPRRVAATILTPTALAEDPAAAERAGAFHLAVDGVPLVGPPRPRALAGPLAAAPVGEAGLVRFAEPRRPSPDDRWRITVIAALPDVDDPAATDRVLVTGELGPAGPIAVTVAADAGQAIAGRSIELVVERLAGRPRRRTDDGSWSTLALNPALGPAVSNAVAVPVGPDTWVVRIERDLAAGTNRLVRFTVGAPGWTVVRAMPAPLDAADGIALVADGDDLIAVTDLDTTLGVWRVAELGGAAAVARIDVAGGRVPVPRESPSIVIHDDRLYVFGGDLEGAAAGDMWSIATAGGPWRPHPLRRREERIGAVLISTAAGLVLIGGDPVAGEMAATVRLWDVAASRSWRDLPSLPIAPGLPGLLVARTTAVGLEAIVWADRTRPTRYALIAGASSWTTTGAIELDAPNPPAPGEAVFVGDDLLVVGPAPLPSSDVVFTQGARGVLAVLPRLALAVGGSIRLRVAADGASFRRDPPDPAEAAIPRPLDSRFGGLFGDDLLAAAASDGRYAQPGRLARVPWQLAQRSLGPWNALLPTSPDDTGAVLLDARLGRFVLPSTAPTGRITVSCR